MSSMFDKSVFAIGVVSSQAAYGTEQQGAAGPHWRASDTGGTSDYGVGSGELFFGVSRVFTAVVGWRARSDNGTRN